jgi:hypothetical protein
MKQNIKLFACNMLVAIFVMIFSFSGCQKTTSTGSNKTAVAVISKIVYTDISPDQQLTCTPISQPHIKSCSFPYQLDLNKDGIVDFTISYSYFYMASGIEGQRRTTTSVQITCNKQNAVAVDSVYPLALNPGDNISLGLNWKSDTTVTLKSLVTNCGYGCNNFYSGNWFASADKMLGLKLAITGKVFYGWALLSGDALTIRSYAFNSISNQLILAGQTK